jgi:hypothetical protein
MPVGLEIDSYIKILRRMMKPFDSGRSADYRQAKGFLDVFSGCAVCVGCLNDTDFQLLG